MKLHEIELISSRMGMVDFNGFYDQPIVIFTSASLCDFTKQFKNFQKLFEDKKIVPIALPTNNFGDGEPGNNIEIHQYYSRYFDITFPIADKTNLDHNFFKMFGRPNWNFNKYLFNKKHEFIKQFNADTEPFDLIKYV
jgi:glutathione peroxidase